MNTQRKILILSIILFILIVGGLFFAYQSFVKGNKTGNFLGITTKKGGGNTLFPGSGLFKNENDNSTKENIPIPTLRQISSVPTSGGVIFDTKKNIVIRYVERATGHIFETTNDSLEQNRISNTTIPRIQESIWSPNGEMVILRYLDKNGVIKSFYGKISKDDGKLNGWFLSNNITDVDVQKDNSIFYIQKIGDDSKGIISKFDGTDSKTVFSSTISDWYPKWMGNSATIMTKPSRNISGFMYLLQSNGYKKILSADGLITSINPSGSKILFSMSNTNETNLFIYNRDNKEITEVPFRTLAEKCTWSSNFIFFCASPYNSINGIVPDDWYKGRLSFSDDIWSYNTKTETAKLVYNADANNKVFDAINLTTDSNGEVLLFTNKDDLTLWSLSLK